MKEILGLDIDDKRKLSGFLEGFLNLYRAAKAAKNYEMVDEIRVILKKEGFILKDGAAQTDWSYAWAS